MSRCTPPLHVAPCGCFPGGDVLAGLPEVVHNEGEPTDNLCGVTVLHARWKGVTCTLPAGHPDDHACFDADFEEA